MRNAILHLDLPGIGHGDPEVYKTIAEAWMRLFLVSEEEEFYRNYVDKNGVQDVLKRDADEMEMIDLISFIDREKLGHDVLHHNDHFKSIVTDGIDSVLVHFKIGGRMSEAFSALKEAERMLVDEF